MGRFLFIAMFFLTARADNGEAWTSAFAWKAPLHQTLQPGQRYRLHLPPSVWADVSNPQLQFRLVDRSQRQWPFNLWVDRDERVERREFLQILSSSWQENDGLALVTTLRRTDPQEHGELTVLLDGGQYRRQARLEALRGDQWVLLCEGLLASFEPFGRVPVRTLFYPPTDLRDLRLTVWPDGENRQDSFQVTAVYVPRVVREHVGVYQLLTMKDDAFSQSREGGDRHFLVARQTHPGAPIHRVSLTVENPEILCPVKVYGRNAATNDWRWVADGVLQDRHAVVELSDHFRYNELRVELRTELEPGAVQVEARQANTYLLFDARSPEPVSLFYGGTPEFYPPEPVRYLTDSAAGADAADLVLRNRVPTHAPELQRALRGPLVFSLAWVGVGVVLLVMLGIWVRRMA